VFLRRHVLDDADALVREVNYCDNPWFPPELRTDMERDKARDPDKYNHVWMGAYRLASEARIFRNWRVGEMEPPERAVWFYGVDFGFAVDPSAALRCCLVEPRTLYVDREAYEVGVPTEALPAFLHQVTGIEAWPSRGDSARPETIDYLRRHGIPKMRAAIKGPGSVEDGITFLQGLDIVVHPRCVNLQREFRMYAYKTDKQTGEILPVPEDANNHLIDALRYAVERLHRKGKLVPVDLDDDAQKRLPRPVDGYSRPREADDEDWKVV
jgi:phage terminase large subunit